MDHPNDPAFAQRLETLSQRVLRHWGAQAWRQLFLGPAQDTIAFHPASLTLLLADSPLPDMDRAEANLLAEHLRADAEIASSAEVALAFRDPAAAFRAALVLQRLVFGHPVRAALSTRRSLVASFALEGVQHQLVIGPEIEEAEAAVQCGSAGSIVLAAETYALIGDLLAHEVQNAIVATELDGERVTRASVTLAPPRSAAVSTFAGLGLV